MSANIPMPFLPICSAQFININCLCFTLILIPMVVLCWAGINDAELETPANTLITDTANTGLTLSAAPGSQSCHFGGGSGPPTSPTLTPYLNLNTLDTTLHLHIGETGIASNLKFNKTWPYHIHMYRWDKEVLYLSLHTYGAAGLYQEISHQLGQSGRFRSDKSCKRFWTWIIYK